MSNGCWQSHQSWNWVSSLPEEFKSGKAWFDTRVPYHQPSGRKHWHQIILAQSPAHIRARFTSIASTILQTRLIIWKRIQDLGSLKKVMRTPTVTTHYSVRLLNSIGSKTMSGGLWTTPCSILSQKMHLRLLTECTSHRSPKIPTFLLTRKRHQEKNQTSQFMRGRWFKSSQHALGTAALMILQAEMILNPLETAMAKDQATQEEQEMVTLLMVWTCTGPMEEDQVEEAWVVENHPAQAQDQVQTPVTSTTTTTRALAKETTIHRLQAIMIKTTEDLTQTDSSDGYQSSRPFSDRLCSSLRNAHSWLWTAEQTEQKKAHGTLQLWIWPLWKFESLWKTKIMTESCGRLKVIMTQSLCAWILNRDACRFWKAKVMMTETPRSAFDGLSGTLSVHQKQNVRTQDRSIGFTWLFEPTLMIGQKTLSSIWAGQWVGAGKIMLAKIQQILAVTCHYQPVMHGTTIPFDQLPAQHCNACVT